MLPKDYPQELIDGFVDYAAENPKALSLLSLVDRRFLSRSRRLVFGDLTVHVCCDPSLHDRHRRPCRTSHCLVTFSRLLRSPHCFIPKAVQRLVLSGRGVQPVRIFYPWSLVSHTGGMDDSHIILPVLKHFHDVNRLELIEIHWFTFSSWSSSRITTKFFSSVRHLVIDNANFYSGPEALFSILNRSSHLESLTILEASWPSANGFPNGAPGYVVIIINFFFRCPGVAILLSPIALVWLAGYKLNSLVPRRHPLQTSLKHLALDCDNPHKPLLRWLQQQKPKFSQLVSAELRPSTNSDSSQLQTILDILPSAPHLIIPWKSFRDCKVPAVPALGLHRELRCLEVRLRAEEGKEREGITWKACVAWLRACLATVTSERLTSLIIGIEMSIQELANALQVSPNEDPVFSQEARGFRWTQTLERVDIRMVVKEGSWVSAEESWRTLILDCVAALFPLCLQKGLLRVQG
ncbi:hypothetical protein B0H11DRAFT_2108402, partial [Mycena galericulata]